MLLCLNTCTTTSALPSSFNNNEQPPHPSLSTTWSLAATELTLKSNEIHRCFVSTASCQLLSHALIDMTESESPAPKESSNGFFKNLGNRLKKPVSRFRSRPSSPQPPASLQDNPTREPSLSHRDVLPPVGRLIESTAGTSATTPQRGDFMDYHLLHGMFNPVQMIIHQPSSQDRSYHCRVLDHPSLQQFRVSYFPSYITVIIIGLTVICRSASCSGSGWRQSS